MDMSSKTVEALLGPLIDQINSMALATNGAVANTTSASNNIFNSSRKGRSKRAQYLVEALVEAIESFLRQSGEIAQENPEMSNELMDSIGDIRTVGNSVVETARDFVNEPISSQKRAQVVKSAHELLNAIARLLTLADVIDINTLMRCMQSVQQDLQNLKTSSNQDELTHHFKTYGRDLVELANLAGKRQAYLVDVKLRDELASARATLKNNSLKLFTSSKVLNILKYYGVSDVVI
jgi:catenin alpha